MLKVLHPWHPTIAGVSDAGVNGRRPEEVCYVDESWFSICTVNVDAETPTNVDIGEYGGPVSKLEMVSKPAV